LRAFNSIEEYGLDIHQGSFTSGRTVAPYIEAWSLDLFLSNEEADVRAVLEAGTAAAAILQPPPEPHESKLATDEVCIAFDGDAVIFDAASERINQEQGLAAFQEHERANAEIPMTPGPFGPFFRKLAALRLNTRHSDGNQRVRIALVTARSRPAHARAVHTLRTWGTPADEAHFVGARGKAPFLKALDAQIFFDDQLRHVAGAAAVVPAGHVVSVTPVSSAA
jgi:5'-nucleotidase